VNGQFHASAALCAKIAAERIVDGVGRWGGFGNLRIIETVWEKRNLLPLPGLDLAILGRPACGVVTVPGYSSLRSFRVSLVKRGW
jgi:hypothetical protein